MHSEGYSGCNIVIESDYILIYNNNNNNNNNNNISNNNNNDNNNNNNTQMVVYNTSLQSVNFVMFCPKI